MGCFGARLHRGEIGAPKPARSSAISLLGWIRERAGDGILRRNIRFQPANVPSSRPPDYLRSAHPYRNCGFYVHSMFYCIRWLSQAISGHGAYISQVNRLIFLNNSLILAKGRSARLSRRRRWDFRPSRGKPAARRQHIRRRGYFRQFASFLAAADGTARGRSDHETGQPFLHARAS